MYGHADVLARMARRIADSRQARFEALMKPPGIQELADMQVGPFVALEGLPRPAPRRPIERSTAPCDDDDHEGMRCFILQQMIEAKDEAGQAGCCRYILRNMLLGDRP